MALPAIAIATAAALEAQGLLKAGADIGLGGGAQYIRDGQPIGIIPLIGQAVARQACRRYGDGAVDLPGDTAANYEKACRPYLEDIGYGSGPTIGKPFEGGQCAIAYDYTWETRDFVNNSNPTQYFWRATGSAGGRLGPIAVVSGPSDGATCPQGESFNNWIATSPSGNVQLSGGCWDVSPSYRNFKAIPRQPELDVCGSPPPVVTPPVPPVGPRPTTEPFSPSPGTEIDIDVTIGPTGPITVNIGVGPITIDPFGGGGDGGDGGDNPGIDQPGTAPSSGLPPGDIGQPAEPVATPPGGTAAGCAPPNSVLVGVKVNILEPLPPVNQYDDQVLRGVCYVYMGVPGNLALDPSGVALRNGQFCLAPVDNLTCWEVRANVNFILRVTPYYRTLELEEV